MISLDVARALARALCAPRSVTLVEWQDARPYLDVAAGLASLVPGGAPIVQQVRALVDDASASVSVTLPVPGSTLVLLSRAATADGVSHAATVLHELVHHRQIEQVGGLQSAVDYLGSGELRAHREAEASGVGLWMRHILTGEVPVAEDASVLRSSLYHLGEPERAHARGVVLSQLGALASGALPPHAVAREALAWLRREAPGAIVAEAYRDTVVPT